MTRSKTPGILHDPWKTVPADERPTIPAKPCAQLKPDATLSNINNGDIDSDLRTLRIVVKDYGGITIRAPELAGTAGSIILDFCVNNLTLIDQVLVEFGILVEKLKLSKQLIRSPIYVQRSDGWTLTVPDAYTRDAAYIQLIQAFLKLNTYPKIRAILTKYAITPYRS